MKHIKKMKIDIDKKNFEAIPSVQYDSNARFLHINLLNGAVPFNLTGCSVKISGTKPDGTAIFNNCTVINAKEGFIEVELTEQMNATPGTVKCEVKLYSGSGVLTTKQFDIEVSASVTSKNVTSGNEFKALEEALSKVNNIDTKFETLTSDAVAKATEKEIQKQIENGNIAHTTIANNSLGGEKLKNKTITDAKIANVSIEKLNECESSHTTSNLYDKATMYEQGYWNDSGVFVNSTQFYNTGYIEVTPLTTYIKSGVYLGDTTKGHPVVFFNADKSRIGNVTRDNIFTTPENCKYINTLVLKPGDVETGQYSMYPYSTTRENFVIVKGDELPQQYPAHKKSYHQIKGLRVAGEHIAPHSISKDHLEEGLNLSPIHVGLEYPPEDTLLWCEVDWQVDEIEGVDFIDEGLIVYLDGRFGTTSPNKIKNRGSGKGEFTHKMNKNIINTPITCQDSRYQCAPGAILSSDKSQDVAVDVSKFTTNDITMMVRCKIPQVISDVQGVPLGIGSSPNWTGFYFKPVINDSIFYLHCNPEQNIMSNKVGSLKGKDVILTMRKSGSTIDLFVNSYHIGSGNHNRNQIDTWKTATDFHIEVGGVGEIGCVLVYGRALSEDEILQNVETESNIRDGLSDVTIASETSANIYNIKNASAGGVKYKNSKGLWNTLKLPAHTIETDNKSDVQRELTKHTEAIKQLSVNGGDVGYVTSSSGVKFKLCVSDSGQLYTTMMKMPRVDIIGSLTGIGKDKPVWAELKYEGEVSFHKKVHMEYQGNTSLMFPKKNFGIDVYELDGITKCDLAFRDWAATDSFHLKANWIDATHGAKRSYTM